MNAVYRKELKGYFTDGIGLILIAVELAVACGFMWMFNLGVYKVSAFEYALSPVSFVYTVAVPLLTMRRGVDRPRGARGRDVRLSSRSLAVRRRQF